MRHPQRALLISAAACTSVVLAATAQSTAYAADESPAERRVQVVMVNFTDSSFPDAAGTKSLLKGAYFGKSKSLTSYYNEVTRGATTFEPGTNGDGGIVGPIDLPMAGAGCDSGKISDLTYKALEEKGIGEDDYEHVSIVFPNQKTNCDYLALGSVGGGTTWMPIDGKDISMTALVHEFGHNFGYSHHMRLRCSGTDLAGCKDNDETSHKTPMGGGGWEAGLTSPELIHSKWLSGKEAVRVAKSGTYTLRPLYGSGSGVRALDIPVGEDRLVVELRGASGTLDKRIEGVHAYRVPKGDYAESALVDLDADADHWSDKGAADADALAAGTTLTDKAGKVEVKVVKSADGAATVAVSLDGVPAPAEAAADPEPSASAQPSGEAAAGAEDEGAKPQTGGEEPAGEQAADGTELAETGSDSTTQLPVAVGGASLLAMGAVFMLRNRRRRATVSATSPAGRHSR
ncbi:LPXTG cell wall anchor domain-containing protein [Streptomyces sp. NBC_01304]|uniref:LPXTG cell wall anchor domain-containing protein n=1 Tax=Streptomyces sp. NBC_01304 TaxID=2903818 RepID=UPI002E168382|nr:LPXTG cell wall anchor domain-containing protein [Streptomyces sp. NBC_01304]